MRMPLPSLKGVGRQHHPSGTLSAQPGLLPTPATSWALARLGRDPRLSACSSRADEGASGLPATSPPSWLCRTTTTPPSHVLGHLQTRSLIGVHQPEAGGLPPRSAERAVQKGAGPHPSRPPLPTSPTLRVNGPMHRHHRPGELQPTRRLVPAAKRPRTTGPAG